MAHACMCWRTFLVSHTHRVKANTSPKFDWITLQIQVLASLILSERVFLLTLVFQHGAEPHFNLLILKGGGTLCIWCYPYQDFQSPVFACTEWLKGITELWFGYSRIRTNPSGLVRTISPALAHTQVSSSSCAKPIWHCVQARPFVVCSSIGVVS